jgi:hypothetical protein
MDNAQRKQAARQRRAGKVRLRRQRVAKAAARTEQQYADRLAANDLLDLVADELEAAIGQTLAERRAEPARQFTSRLVETDSDTALEDESAERLGLKLAFVLLADWHRGLRSNFDGPALAEDALHWIRSNLDAEATNLAEHAAPLLASSEDERATTLRLLETFDVDLLSALIWLTAGVTATHGGGDPAWLRQYESR